MEDHYEADEPQEVEWLIKDLIPRGFLTVLAGPPGLGKDQLGIGLASLLSNGRPMPDGSPTPIPAGSAYINPEDDPHVTVSPRMIAAGANRMLARNITKVSESEDFTIQEHTGWLRGQMAKIPNCQFVWMGPLTSITTVNPTSPVSVRRKIMNPLNHLAADKGAAVILVTHFNEDGEVGGSKAIVQAARTVLAVGKDPNNESIRTLSVMKSNLVDTATAPVLRYVIEGDGAYTAVRFLDMGAVLADIADDDVSAEPKPGTGRYRILKLLRDTGEPMTAQMISSELDIAYHTVRVLLGRLGAFIKSPARGVYQAVTTVTADPDQEGSQGVAVTSNSVVALPGIVM